jgi:DNA-binding FadR family transcriptional regulator
MKHVFKDLTPVRPKKSSEIVADRLRLAIVKGDIPKGDALPAEHELIESFGVGRATMREALRILETEGLLNVTRGAKGGAQVIGPTLGLAAHAVGMVLQGQGTRLADVQVARQIIEPPAARMVAERQSPETIKILTELLEAEKNSTPADFPFAAMRFHEALIQLSGNHTLSIFLMVLHEIHEGVAVGLSARSNGSKVNDRVVEIHETLIDLIKAGEGEAAETLWRDYWAWIVPFTHPEEAVVDVLHNLGDENV